MSQTAEGKNITVPDSLLSKIPHWQQHLLAPTHTK